MVRRGKSRNFYSLGCVFGADTRHWMVLDKLAKRKCFVVRQVHGAEFQTGIHVSRVCQRFYRWTLWCQRMGRNIWKQRCQVRVDLSDFIWFLCTSIFLVVLSCRYVVLTSKHHDGYALWPSKYSFSWNSVDTGPHRDIIKELAEAVTTKTSMKFGLYHSLFEWFHPIYMENRQNSFKTNEFVTTKVRPKYTISYTNYFIEIWNLPIDFTRIKRISGKISSGNNLVGRWLGSKIRLLECDRIHCMVICSQSLTGYLV